VCTQALHERLPPGGPPPEHDAAAFQQWRESLQVRCCQTLQPWIIIGAL